MLIQYMRSIATFSEFETHFLEPLRTRRYPQREDIPLEQMAGWLLENGKLSSPFFEIIGVRTSFEAEKDGFQPRNWDQPLYRQGTGTLILFIDENKHLLVQAVFEPGNASRGYKNGGLTLSNSCKFSPGNLAYLLHKDAFLHSPTFSIIQKQRNTSSIMHQEMVDVRINRTTII